jgi:hypothetical protein
VLKTIIDYIFEPILKNEKLKIGVKKITCSDINRFNDESVDFSYQIIPKIYEYFKRYPREFDILIGYYGTKFDWYDDSVILISDDRLFTLENYNRESLKGSVIINNNIKVF